jgi:hypothetical protein
MRHVLTLRHIALMDRVSYWLLSRNHPVRAPKPKRAAYFGL